MLYISIFFQFWKIDEMGIEFLIENSSQILHIFFTIIDY